MRRNPALYVTPTTATASKLAAIAGYKARLANRDNEVRDDEDLAAKYGDYRQQTRANFDARLASYREAAA